MARVPGTIAIRGHVINTFAQDWWGRPQPPHDSAERRLQHFNDCLEAIGDISGLESVAFPYKIGCGLARGDWAAYRSALEKFAADNPGVTVTVVRKV